MTLSGKLYTKNYFNLLIHTKQYCLKFPAVKGRAEILSSHSPASNPRQGHWLWSQELLGESTGKQVLLLLRTPAIPKQSHMLLVLYSCLAMDPELQSLSLRPSHAIPGPSLLTGPLGDLPALQPTLSQLT